MPAPYRQTFSALASLIAGLAILYVVAYAQLAQFSAL
jgi:hypothetical protein